MSDPRETSYYVDPTKRSIVLPGMAADRFYNLAVRGYRRVDKDIASNGVIFSELTPAKSWRYQPSASVAFNGDITGTIRGVSTLQVVTDLNAIVDDGILSRPEKQSTVLLWSNLHSQWDAASSKAGQLGGLDSYVAAAGAAISALDSYLTGLTPTWNDLGVDTPIDPQTMQNAFGTAQAKLADLIAMNIDRASELASWSAIKDDDGNKPEPGATAGAVIGVDVKNPDGTIFVPGASEVDMDAVRAEIERELAEAMTDLDNEVEAVRQEAASARSEAATASADAATVRSDLATEVERAKGQEGTLSTRVTTAQGRADAAHTAISTETTQRADADKALSSRADTMDAKFAGTQESELLARIRTEETTRASDVAAVASRATVLETSTRSSGNLLPNSDLATMDGWTVSGNGIGASTPRIRADANDWIPRGESVLYTDRPGTNDDLNGYVETLSSPFAVQAGTWVQFYALTAVHRARAWVSLFFYDMDGVWIGHAGENFATRSDNGGPFLENWEPTGQKAYKVPANAVQARLSWRMYNLAGQADGVAWMFRPIVMPTKEGQTEWLPYSPGSSRPQTLGSNAKIAEEATVRSNADSALANRVTTTEAKLAGTTDSELAARIRTEETARTNADSALASRTSTIESTYNTTGTGVTINDKFANWVDGARYPRGWDDWAAEGRYTVSRTSGSGGSPYSIYTANDADTSYGFMQTVPCPDGKYVLEVTVRNDGGNMSGAGATLHGDYTIDFVSDPDTRGVVGETAVGQTRTWVKVFDIAGYAGGINVHGMGGWLGFGRSIASHYITWFKLNLRPAGPGDIAGVKNAADIVKATASIAEEATTRANAVSALASRSSTLESQMGGTATSALKTLIDDNRRNLAQVGWWRKGATIPWGLNGGQRNEIVEFPHGPNFSQLPMPDGSSGDAWLCQAQDGQDNAGGWDGATMSPLDPDKTYRFIVPIAQLGGFGSRNTYWGCNGVAYLNTTDNQPNPYFAVANYTNVKTDKWYLYVGYLFPRNSTGKTHAGAGVYDMETGELVVQGENFCFLPDGRQPIHRAYQYYAYGGAYAAFGRPLVELIDGSETPFPVLSTYSRKVSARITAEETARSNADSALATRASTLEAQMSGTQDSTLAARIRDEATARANATSAIATRTSTLETKTGNLESRTGIVETAVIDAKTKLAAARLELSAVSPGGRASVTLRSDNNSGAGVDIVGDVSFSGKLNVGGTTGARLEIKDNVIKVYDENGALVGKIGNLAL